LQLIIDLCREFAVERLVYTSSIEVTYHDNQCDNVSLICHMQSAFACDS